MNLSTELVSQFVKITKDEKKTKTETIHYGTVKEKDGRFYVKLDGSELLTPIRTVASLHVDDRVTVMIKNHTAVITGNITTPSARTSDVESLNRTAAAIEKRISEWEENNNHIVTKEEFDAEKAKIVALQEADKTLLNDIDNLQKTTSAHATDITDLKSEYIDLEQRVSNVEETTSGLVSNDEFEVEKAKISALQKKDTQLQNGIDSLSERVDDLESEIDSVKSTTDSNVSGLSAEVNTLKSTVIGHSSDIGTIKTDISTLKTSKMDADVAEDTYSKKTEYADLQAMIVELQDQIANMPSANSQIQIITWETND